jgi:hypothetical protein
MFGLPLLDVVIGMIFLYLLLSVVCTAIVEWLSGLRRQRARVLTDAVTELLRAGDAARDGGAAAPSPNDFFAHPLIQSLYRPTSATKATKADAPHNKPSYVPARTFALTLLDLIAPATVDAAIVQSAVAGNVEAQQAAHAAHAAGVAAQRMTAIVEAVSKLPEGSYLRRTLQVLIADARGDLATLQENVEVWYNHVMDRASGWYKRWTQRILFALALAVAVAANADTISLSRRLASDSALRAAVVAQAEAYAKRPPAQNPHGDSSYAAVKAAIDSLNGIGLPLGWSHADLYALRLSNRLPGDIESSKMGDTSPWLNWPLKIAGLLITGFAVSLGAPFWFDMLNKVISIRATGPSPEEKPKSPEGGPKRRKEQAPQ